MNELNKLASETKDLTVSLNELSAIYKRIEEILERENKFKIEFSYQTSDTNGIIISWRRYICNKKKKCRLYATFIDLDIEKAIDELPIELRVEAAQYLFQFVNAFKEFMKVKSEEIQDTISELKSELECF